MVTLHLDVNPSDEPITMFEANDISESVRELAPCLTATEMQIITCVLDMACERMLIEQQDKDIEKEYEALKREMR